ncbi:MAG: DNA polymerase IV [Marinilabiliales bacterium]|nr:MAG: DNA polymerase IV [Marinilabiliales bacterium]
MTKNNRSIIHLDLDTFFVSVERLVNSSLNNKPVIIGGTSDRGVVSSCSYEARLFGVHSGMPMKMARMLCEDAIIVRGDMDQYTKYSKLVTEIIAERAPLFEKTSIDEHYIDLTGMDRFFGCKKWSKELRTYIIKHSGLPISFGLSINKTVSKIATGEAKPNGEQIVEKSQIDSFLAPLSIRKIPMIGKQTYRLLRSMGVKNIETLRAIPVTMMEQVLGKQGTVIWKKANGIDHTPIKPYSEKKSISKERTFETDTIDVHMLGDIITKMTENLCFSLRKKQKLTSCVTVKIRYANFDTHTMQARIAYTSFDHTLIKTAHELFEKLYNRRMLIRLVGVKFSHLVTGVQQLDLFDNKPELADLYIAMDKIRLRYGSGSVQRGIGYKSRTKSNETCI